MAEHKFVMILRDEKNNKILTVKSSKALIDLESDKYDVDADIMDQINGIIPAENLSDYSGEPLTVQITNDVDK